MDGLMSSEHTPPGLAGPPKAPRRLLRSRHSRIFVCGGYESRNASRALGSSRSGERIPPLGNSQRTRLSFFPGGGRFSGGDIGRNRIVTREEPPRVFGVARGLSARCRPMRSLSSGCRKSCSVNASTVPGHGEHHREVKRWPTGFDARRARWWFSLPDSISGNERCRSAT